LRSAPPTIPFNGAEFGLAAFCEVGRRGRSSRLAGAGATAGGRGSAAAVTSRSTGRPRGPTTHTASAADTRALERVKVVVGFNRHGFIVAASRADVAQHFLLRYGGYMPVATARKVEALRHDFRSAAQLADMLGVSRSQVTRWLRGAGIDPLNAEKVDLLELVWSNLLRIYEKEAALAWLFGLNPRLGDRRPIDLVRAGRTEELMRAVRAERADSFA
jgi:uncharacterized protein (DUF2384 family)